MNICYFLLFFVAIGLTRYADKKLLEKKQNQIDRLYAQVDVLDRFLTMKEKNVSIDSFLKENDFHSVGIYGLAMIGNHLYEEMKKSNYITKLVGIDRSEINDNFDMEIRKNTDDFSDLDVILVTALSDYNGIKRLLQTNYNGEIKSIQDIVGECEKNYSYSDEVAYCDRE